MFIVRFLCISLLGWGLSSPAIAAMSPNRAAILEHNLEAMDARLSLIGSAQEEILLETFWFEPDAVGGTLLKALLQRKRERPLLRARILFDAWGSKDFDEELATELRSRGIEIKRYNVATLPIVRRNHRDHRKLLIADGKSAIIGGRNVANVHFGANAEFGALDRELVLEGPIVAELKRSFEEYWTHPYSEPFGRLASSSGQGRLDRLPSLAASHSGWRGTWYPVSAELFSDAPGLKREAGAPGLALLRAIRQAKGMLLEGAHVILGDTFAEELAQARARGAAVTVFTNSPLSITHYEYTSFSLSYFRLLEAVEAGITVWGHDPRPTRPEEGKASRYGVHTKSYLIDDGLWIGSYNLDPRSHTINSELLLRVTGIDLNRKVHSNMIERYSRARRLHREGYEGWADRMAILPQELLDACARAKMFRYVLEPFY